jgi:hypothetical protein
MGIHKKIRNISKKPYVSPKSIHNKRRRKEEQLLQLFQQIDSGLSCAAVARSHGKIKVRALQRKYKQWKGRNHQFTYKNQSKQIFTPEQEAILASHINALIDTDTQTVSKDLVKEMALQYFNELHPQQNRVRCLKFTASDGWVSKFKARWHFPSHKIKPTNKRSKQAETVSAEKIAVFKNEVVNAVMEYGANMVMNMDETPAKCVEMPTRGWNTIGSRGLLKTKHKLVKKNVTIMPTVTAAGGKLPLAWINQGKTDLGIQRKKLPKNIFSYFSNSGWVNGGIMLRYLKEVVLPYTKKRPAALLLDNYEAHWEENVTDFCSKNKIRLIEVPEGETADLQPLNISVNGPMKQKRRKLYLADRQADPDTCDTVEKAVWRAAEGHNSIDSKTIQKGWRQISATMYDSE